MELVPHAFFGCIKHDQIDEVYTILNKYDIGKFIISLETAPDTHKMSNGEHMHFYVEMFPKDYLRFAKRVFIDKYKLKGKASGGVGRQYGKVKNIENLERMQAYTIKDGNIRTNMTEKEIDALKEISFEKKGEHDHFNKLMKFITDSMTNHEYALLVDEIGDVSSIQKYIILFHIKEQSNRDVSRSTLDRCVRMWIMYHSGLSELERCNLIRNLLHRY